MVARIESGKSIRSVLVYNEKKLESGAAQLLLASGFPLEAELLSFKNKVSYFKKFTRQKLRVKTNTLHITLNFSPKDKLDSELLKQIAKEYMESIGFGDQPYLVYQHFDAAHPHLHIATVNIENGGKRIATHKLGRTKSMTSCRKIETDFGLISAEGQSKQQRPRIDPFPLERVIYGKEETKRAISNVVLEVLKTYKLCSLIELNTALNQFGVYASRGQPESTMFKNGGLVYGLQDQNNKKVGVPIKASTIYSRPTLKHIHKLFVGNKLSRKPYGIRLKLLLEEALAKGKNQEAVARRLRQQGIRVVFRKNKLGNLSGVTYIDNTTRVVYNGSDLGKKYVANEFLEELQKTSGWQLSDLEASPSETTKNDTTSELELDPPLVKGRQIPGLDLTVIETIIDTLNYDDHESNELVPSKKKRKKLQLSR